MARKQTITLGSILSFILGLMFAGIMLFIVFAMMDMTKAEAFVPAIIFMSINLVIIICLTTFGRGFMNMIGSAFYISMLLITLLYTIFQFVHMFFTVNKIGINGYMLYHLIVLFAYFIIITPIMLMGNRNERSDPNNLRGDI